MKCHFIGIAGTGMGNAAGLMKEKGWMVTGSDEAVYPPMSEVLDKMEVEVKTPFSGDNINSDSGLLVVGNICRYNHVEVLKGTNCNLKLTSFPALIGNTILNSRKTVVVAGTHGKTTTSSMVAHILNFAGRDPGYLIGGVPHDLPGSYHLGEGKEFVIEGDEYDTAFFDKNPKFIHYRPKCVILTGIEFDHADIYRDFKHVNDQFRRLRAITPPNGDFLVSADNRAAMKLIEDEGGNSYGLKGEESDFYSEVFSEGTFRKCNFYSGMKKLGEYQLKLSGEHNLRNATGAVAMALCLGVNPEVALEAISEFNGVRRRQEVLGNPGNVTVVDDFGHHPTAVRLTLEGLKKNISGRIASVFEPRSATSRRSVFQKDYADSLKVSDAVFLSSPYDQSRIDEKERFSSELLTSDLKNSGVTTFYSSDPEELKKAIANWAEPGDWIIFFSSGSFGGLREGVLASLERKFK
ncbi:MAG: UDP-N-acetylmuramate:L-alanyl-gamma-D-glutamyl-meso-diaminopimelate ligase [Deltaproteobacteria bacterium]|nr:UDP-N-acetylmuramate:L-alanyl-gamma-D-glutamyl-meso-diaminopimelate ligase [Deltaproteobacteria bacterium]